MTDRLRIEWALLVRRALALSVLFTLTALCTACSGPARISLGSVANHSQLDAKLPTRVYSAADANTVDVYLTNLPAPALAETADISAISGFIVHLHMFIAPRAGRTPIAASASNVTVRCMVIAKGEVGVYGGGGFLRDSGSPGDTWLGGKVEQATLTLLKSTPGFRDRLGATEFAANFSAKLDNQHAAELAAVLSGLMAEMADPPTIRPP